MVFLRSFCMFLVRNSFADVVSHYMSIKIYQNSTKEVCIKSRYCKLYYKLHTENLKLNNIFHHLTNFHGDKRLAPTNFAVLITQNQSILSNLELRTGLLQKHPYLRTPLLECPPLKYPPLICPPLKYSPLKCPPLNVHL